MALSYTQASQVKKETPVQTTKISAPTLNTYQQATAAPAVSTPVLNSVQPAIVNRPPTNDLAYQSVLGGNNYLAKKAESDAAAAAEAQRVAAAQAASKKPTDDLAYQSLVSGNNYLAKKEESDYREKVTNAGINILESTLPQNSYVRNTLDRSSAEIALGRLSYMAEKEAKEAEEQARKEAEEAEKARQEYLQNRNIFQKAWTAIGAGAGQVDSMAAQFVNMAATGIETAEAWWNGGFTSDGKFVKGEAPFTGSLFQPIHDWANWTTSTANKLSEENKLQAKTAAGRTANEIAAGVIAAAPQAVLALMTMGGSTAGTLATQSAGMTNSVNAALSKLSSNPSFWASFVQEAGGNFAEAKAAGATDEQAITAATISGLANAMIEVGGGIEDNAWLNDETLTKLQKAGKLAGSAFGEGKEELIQNPISRATQKLVYDKDKAWFSLTDEDAVINPKASAKEFAMGTAVGGILSGANFAINAGVNAANKANIRNAANSGIQTSLDEAIMQTLTAPQIDNMTAAEKVSYIENVKKTANQQTLTEKALGINENQTDNRTTQQNLPQNPISQEQSVITAPQAISANTQENTARSASLDEAIMSALESANAQAEKNAAPIAEADSTVINDDPDVHTAQEQKIIEEYKNSADGKIAKFYTDAQSGIGEQFLDLSPVSLRQAGDIKAAIGVDAAGFKTKFEDRQARHIEIRHGENGLADSSMRDISDVARIQYVLDNYDDLVDGGTTDAYIEFRNGKNRPAKTVLLSKKVNGTYYVVEAAPITKARSVYIVSAYMNKEGASHSVDTDNLSRRNGATVSENAPGNNVAQESKNVNAAADNDLGAKRSEFQSEQKQIQPQTAQSQNQSSENAQLLDDVDTAIEQVQNEIEQTKWALEWSDDTERAAHTKRLAQLNSQLNALEETRQNIVNRGNTQTEQSSQIPQTARNDAPGAKRADFQSEQKLSKFGTNTLNAVESQEDIPAEARTPLSYDTISEEQSIANANLRLEQDYDGEVENLRNKNEWTGEETDMAMLVREELRNEARETGDWAKYNEWRKVVQSHVSTTAQALQALAKWSRQTAGTIVDKAAQVLEKAKKGVDKAKTLNTINGLADKYDAAVKGTNGDTDIDGLLDIIRETSEIRKTSSAKNGKIKGLEWAIERVANLARAEVESGENGDYVEFLRAFAANSIYNIAADTNKISFGEALKTIRRQAMLSKVSTIMRNLTSNNVFDPVDSVSRNMSVPLDMLLSKITGTRSVAADASWLSKAKRTGSLNGLAKACMEVGLDVSVSAEGKYENTAGRTFKMSGGIFSKVMSTWEAIEGYSLNATDEFQKGGIEESVQQGIDRLYEQGKIKDDSLRNAGEQEALYRTFQDETAISKIATKGRSVLNEAGRTAAERLGFNPSEDGLGVGDVILPFAQVPSNLAARAIEYSPAGLIKSTVSLANVLKAAKQGTLTAAQQAQAVQGIGRGINGTAMIAIAAAGALRGWLVVAGDDDDKNKAGMEKGQGLTGTQLNLDAALRDLKGEGAEWRDGDTLLSIGFLDPMNAQLTTGALLADDIKEAEGETLKDRLGNVGFGRIFGDSLSGAIQSVLDTPMMSQFASIADSIKYSKAETAAGKAVDAAKQFAAGIPSSFIPNALTGIAQGTDSVERNAYSSDSIGQQTIDSIKASIPGLRQTLPAKQDSWGNDVTNEGGIQNFLNRNINPGTVTKYKTNEIETELERISEATGESLFPQKSAPYSVSFTKDGEKQNVKLDYEQRTAYQKAYGDAYASAISDLLGSNNYNDMPDEMKAEILNKAENIATNKAKDSLGIGFTMSDDDRAVYDAGAKEKVDSLIVSAIGSKKYLSDDLKSGYDNAKSAISALDDLPEEVRKAAADKAQEYFLAVEKSKYGKELEKSQAELANLSDEELANYFISKSVESSKYLSEEGMKANNIVQKNIGNNFGLSDEIMSKANEKAQNYYVALERAKYGTELSDTYKELDGLSYSELADYFVNKAVKDRYTDENESGSSWDELSDALQKNEIDDATVFAVLPEEQTIAYDRWGKTAGVSAQQWLDALSFHNSEAGKTEYDDDDVEIVSAKDKLQNYIDGQSGMSQEQKDAIMRGFYNDNPATYKYLVSAINSGEITPEAAKKELTPSQQSGWSHNVKQTGTSMANYISAVDTYIEAPTEDERKKLGYKSKWEWYVDELNKTGLNQQQKYAIFISMNGSISDKNKAAAYNKLK